MLAAQIISFVAPVPSRHPPPHGTRAPASKSSEARRSPMKLDGKIALVTGGTSGIGLAAATLFHSEGAQVVVIGNDPDRLGAAAPAIGRNTLALRADLRRTADIDRVIEAVRERFGRLDV